MLIGTGLERKEQIPVDKLRQHMNTRHLISK